MAGYVIEYKNKNNAVEDTYVRETEVEAKELCDGLNETALFPELGSWSYRPVQQQVTEG